MVAEKVINIDLNDPRAKQIAEVLGNESCKHILNLIAEKELTESDIAKELKVPLNTVDYNIKKLISAGLVESTSHFWSIRGKRMPSYRVSEKKIVIFPKRFSSRVFIAPILLVGGALALGVQYLLFRKFSVVPNLMVAKSVDLSNEVGLMSSVPIAETVVQANGFMSFVQNISSLEWALIGLWLGAIFVLLLTNLERRLKK